MANFILADATKRADYFARCRIAQFDLLWTCAFQSYWNAVKIEGTGSRIRSESRPGRVRFGGNAKLMSKVGSVRKDFPTESLCLSRGHFFDTCFSWPGAKEAERLRGYEKAYPTSDEEVFGKSQHLQNIERQMHSLK